MGTLAASASHPPRATPSGWLQSRWTWCLLAVALVLVRAVGGGEFADLLRGYGDTDDATRLVQVRAFMAGTGWYDLMLERFGGATPLVSHWSRLIDVPLAALLSAFGLVLSPAHAELAVRFVWPTLLLLLLFRMLAAEAEHHSGPVAALLVLALAATMLTGLFRFLPGRIDHHNVMILAAVAGVLRGVRAIETPRLGYGAGALLGLALIIGYEPIALIVPVVALAAIAAAIDTRLLSAVRAIVIGLAASFLVGLVVTLPVSTWLQPVCDAISLNVVAACVIGAAGLVLIDTSFRNAVMPIRLAILAVTGVAALGAFAGLSPACLAGPFAAVGTDAKRLWLDHVRETRALPDVWLIAPDSVIVIVLTTLFALAAAIHLYRSRPTPTHAALIALVVIAAVPTALAYKLYPYVSFIAAFVLAIAIARFDGTARLPVRTARLAAVFALNQATLAVITVPLVLAITQLIPAKSQAAAAATRQAMLDTDRCFDFDSVRPLASLPQGLVAAQVDLGAFIVASTAHDVIAAPYHRIDRAIVLSYEIFAASPERAAALLRRTGADYVVKCMPSIVTTEQPAEVTLAVALERGSAVPFLTPVPLSAPTPLRVWRVTR